MTFSPRVPNPQGMDATPGYPRANPCLSFWLQHTRSSPLHGHRTTETLPDKADVTIIGSGLSGAATAYFLLTTGPEEKRPRSVTLLEAREACDGATARNGGHCRPDCYRGWWTTSSSSSSDSDHVAMDQPVADALAASYAEFAADGGHVEGIVTPILDPAQARKETRCPAATVAYKSPSGSLFPRKLVLHLLTLCVEKYGMNLQTHTPVRRVVSSAAGGGGGWRVETDRGVLETEKVVYATNAFTATLLPEFLGHIYPFRGQCSAVVPPAAYAEERMLRGTYALAYGDYHLQRSGIFADYLIQRADGVVIFGGQRGSVPAEQLRGNTDDTDVNPQMTTALREALPRHFEEWPKETELAHVWTGIMGYTTEGIPYVGELHDKPGAFVCAGHHGHGMARIMTCAKGLAALIQGDSWESTGLPECFQPTRERLARPVHEVVHTIV
ncbi:FAD dependent oxidoreductase [Mycena haematopus]|nr:FAD dependent oxidoreductase [Mycena haematopus]